jgi:hypothetical protein
MKLIYVGHWKDSKNKIIYPNPEREKIMNEAYEFAIPQKIKTRDYSLDLKEQIVDFLQNGNIVTMYLGNSSCRFNCGISSLEMGNSTLTDGKFIWPAGYYHYIESHNLAIPELFLQRMMKNNFQYKENNKISPTSPMDISHWLDWCKENQKSDN